MLDILKLNQSIIAVHLLINTDDNTITKNEGNIIIESMQLQPSNIMKYFEIPL